MLQTHWLSLFILLSLSDHSLSDLPFEFFCHSRLDFCLWVRSDLQGLVCERKTDGLETCIELLLLLQTQLLLQGLARVPIIVAAYF